MIEQARSFATGETLIAADAGYHGEADLKALGEPGIRAACLQICRTCVRVPFLEPRERD